MSMRSALRIFAGATILTFSLLARQSNSPPSPPAPAQMVANQVTRLTTLLNLSTTQQSQATTIFTTEQTAMSGIVTSMQTARTALQTAIQNNDVAAIAAQATQIGSLTTQEVEARSIAQATFYGILTADQQTKYKELIPAGPGGPRGPRGFPGPGPGHPPQ